MTGSGFDVAIVGGGIVGAACASACARAGMRVVLIERDLIGGGATAAGMGHVVVMDDSAAQMALTRYSQILWAQLAGELPSTAEFETTGTLWVAADDEEMAEAEHKHALYRKHDIPAELISECQLAKLEPNLRSGLTGALLVPEDAVVYPPIVALHLARDAELRGASIMLGSRVSNFGKGAIQLEDGRKILSSRIVDATGAWASDLHPDIPIKKRKGHLVITDRYPGFVRHQLVELGYLKSAHSVSTDSVAFNLQPRRTGQILIGSSRQYDNEDPAADQYMISAMLDRAIRYMPGVASLQALRTWTGFRAATPDKLPLIGPSNEDDSVWLATGHEGLGITTALGTAALLCASFTGRELPIPAEPYLPSRFLRS